LTAVELYYEAGAALGEGPRWDPRTNELHWVDIERGEIHRLEHDTRRHHCVSVGQSVGAAVPLRNGDGWIAGLRDGVAIVGRDGRVVESVPVDAARPRHRMNDGACDTAGRFWTGTLDEDHGPASDALYRVDHDLAVESVVTGIGLSNGLAWSPDDATMYRVDSALGSVFRCDFDAASGTRGAEEVLAVIDAADGEPDGITVDRDGFVWVALWDGWALRRLSPSGDVDAVVQVPVARPTSCTFGGPDLDTLFVTTARIGLAQDALREQPWAGHILSWTPGVSGLPLTFFGAR
jgi:sugar lactone lactonase YvrE